MTKLVAILAMVSMTGCSIFMTRGPSDSIGTPTTAQKSPPDCTTSMAWPTLDGVVAGVITLGLIAGISSKNEADRPDSNAVTGGFLIAGTAGVGALIGHSRVTKCRRATETYTAQTYGPAQGYGYQQGYAYPQGQYPQGQYPQGQYPQGYTYPQQYPTPAPQQYPPQQYPAPQQPAPPPQPPAQNTTKVPPVPLNPPIPKPPPKPPAPKQPPPPPKPESILGTEGDVCTGSGDCGAGLACTGNVCVKK